MSEETVDRKPFKDTKFMQFVREKVAPVLPKVMQIVGSSNIPILSMVGKVGDMIEAHENEVGELAEVSQEFQIRMKEFEQEAERINNEGFALEVQDRNGARDMRKTMGAKDPLMFIVAMFLLAASAILIWVGLFRTLSDAQLNIYARLEGFFFGSGLTALIAFLFGSTRGSQRKNELIEKLSK